MGTSVYEVHEICSGFWRIEDDGVRAFLIAGTQKALLVDTGRGTGDLKKVVESLTSLPIRLVNTHTDPDHIGCNAQFEASWMHPAEYDRYHFGKPSKLPVHPLWEGDIIDVDERRFEVILIPGHTPGSIALLDAEHRLLLAGDSIQTGNIFMFGPGRNILAYIESMEKLLKMSSRFDVVYPSHSSIPISPDILGDLISGARKVHAGKIPATQVTVYGNTVTAYDVGVAKFLYQ